MNETLRGTWTRTLDRWRAMGPNTRRNLIVLAVALLAALSAILWVVARPHYVTIMSGLDNKSLGQVENQLQQLKISSQIQGASVLVPQNEANQARVQLAMKGLPQSGYIGYSSVGGSIGMTQDQFNIQVLDALQRSLNATISSIDGVDAAQVHIVMPQSQLFVTQPTSNAKASVFVTLGSGVQLSSSQVSGIQQLVAHSVKGLKVDNVTVVDQNGVTLSGSAGQLASVGTASTELGMREKLESNMTQKLTTGLQQIVGVGNAVVVVHAGVTFNQVKSNAHTLHGAPGSTQGFVTSQQVNKSQSNSTNGAAGGPTGQAGSNPNLPSYTASGNSGNSTSNQSNTTTNYNYSTTDVQTTADPMQIQGYRVGVFLNSNDKSITPAEIKQIKAFVTSVVGQKGSANNIAVSSVPFTKPSKAVHLHSPNQNYLLYGLAALVFVGIVGGVLMRRKRRSRSDEPTDVIAKLEDSYETAFDELPPTEDELLRKQLVGMAEQRPDDFASLVRTWLSSD